MVNFLRHLSLKQLSVTHFHCEDAFFSLHAWLLIDNPTIWSAQWCNSHQIPMWGPFWDPQIGTSNFSRQVFQWLFSRSKPASRKLPASGQPKVYARTMKVGIPKTSENCTRKHTGQNFKTDRDRTRKGHCLCKAYAGRNSSLERKEFRTTSIQPWCQPMFGQFFLLF